MEFSEKIVYFICWEKVCYPANRSEKYLYQLLSIVACRIRDISLHMGDVGFLRKIRLSTLLFDIWTSSTLFCLNF